jgi:hypothetical protein
MRRRISTPLNAQQIGGLCFDSAQPSSGAETPGLSGAETHIPVNLFLEIAL